MTAPALASLHQATHSANETSAAAAATVRHQAPSVKSPNAAATKASSAISHRAPSRCAGTPTGASRGMSDGVARDRPGRANLPGGRESEPVNKPMERQKRDQHVFNHYVAVPPASGIEVPGGHISVRALFGHPVAG